MYERLYSHQEAYGSRCSAGTALVKDRSHIRAETALMRDQSNFQAVSLSYEDYAQHVLCVSIYHIAQLDG